MALHDELAWLDATAQAALVGRGEVTPRELVEAAIRQIEKLNPQLNAVITPMFDLALETATRLLPTGPFMGVPFLLKDLQAAYEGVSLSAGSRWLREFKPNGDSELVKRYKRAGLVIIGKTNTPEFGLLPTTEPTAFGATRNPWDLTRTPGGSSGGSAAAVAAGLTAFAHANDGGGSIRIPASCCGLFGLKPTRGRNPLGPHFGDIFSGLVVEHAVTRSVRDSAALLDATTGYDPGDPYIAPVPVRPFAQEVGAPPGKLRIAFSTQAYTGVPVHADCVGAVQEAARLCAELGHDVVEAAPQLHGELLSKAFFTVWAAGCAWSIDSYAFAVGRKPNDDEIEPMTRVMIGLGRKRSAPEYLLAVQTLQIFARRIAQFMEAYDLFLTPVLAEPPVPLGTFAATPDDAMAGMKRSGLFAPFTALQNMTGQPAMSVPLYWNSEGLPIGVQFAARYGAEATLFRLAAQLEAARPWANKHPTMTI
jgi:amidase